MRARKCFCCWYAVAAVAALGMLASTSVQAQTIGLFPVSSTGVQCANAAQNPATCDWYLDGGAIKLHRGGVNVNFELLATGWDDAGCDPVADPGCDQVGVYGGRFDCATFGFDKFGSVLPIGLDCSTQGDPNACIGSGQYVDETRADYIFAGLGTLPGCNVIDMCPGTGDPGFYACSSLTTSAVTGAVDNDTLRYGADMAVAVSADAAGTANVGLFADPNETFLSDFNGANIPLASTPTGTIIVLQGSCCIGVGAAAVCDDVTNIRFDQCQAAGGFFNEGGVCTGNPQADCEECTQDSDCADQDGCTANSCVGVPGSRTCQDTAVNVPAGSCCDPASGNDLAGTGVICQLDNSNECVSEACSNGGTSGTCQATVLDGQACAGVPECFANGLCQADGSCLGVPINTLSCTDVSECPAGATGCDGTNCICDTNAKLSIEVADSGAADDNCFNAGQDVWMTIHKAASSQAVTGGQVLLTYDPACLRDPVVAADGDYPLLLFQDVDEAAGHVFFAVGVQLGGAGIAGEADLGSVHFKKMGACGECQVCFDSINPQNTILSNDEGNSIGLEFNCSKLIRLTGTPSLTTPGNFASNPPCDSPTLIHTWDPLSISASDSCDEEAPEVTCTATHSEGININHLAEAGGEFPQGNSRFECCATNSCGVALCKEWTVDVSDQHSLDVVIQLSPVMTPSQLERCICFEFYSDCVQPPSEWCVTGTFGPPWDFPGHWTPQLKVPKGQFACLTAKDPSHTLRSVSDIVCDEDTGGLSASFKGDPFFGGNWLIGGNLDCWKADGNGDTIDILDFGMFSSQFGDALGDSECNPTGAHSDINGDGTVDVNDFAFIRDNFLENSKNPCCGPNAGLAVDEEPITSITVKELRRLGLDEAAAGDWNNDGVLDLADMNAFQAGDFEVAPVKRGSNVRGAARSLGSK